MMRAEREILARAAAIRSAHRRLPHPLVPIGISRAMQRVGRPSVSHTH